jgi:hypothetical protein
MDTIQKPIATLLLRTTDLMGNGSINDVGQLLNTNGWQSQYNNLSLSEIIGQDEFDRYEYFELQHITTIQSINTGTAINGTNALTSLSASGLPFICNYVFSNSSYAVASQPQLRSDVYFSEILNLVNPSSPYNYFVSQGTISTTSGSIYSAIEPSPLVFSKIDNFDLKLTAKIFDTNAFPNTAKTSEDVYLFKIKGVTVPEIRSQFCLRGILPSSLGVYTYNNFNMRLALGVLWDKYELFNIKMTRMFHTFDGVASGINNNDRPCYITIKGLDFISCKNFVTNTVTQEQTLCYLNWNNSGNTYAGFKNNLNEGVVFKKGKEVVNLELSFKNIIGTNWAYDFTRSHMFYMMITPIK